MSVEVAYHHVGGRQGQVEPEDLHLMIDALAEGIYVLNPDWEIIALNDAAEAYFGRPRGLVLGRPFLEVFPQAAGTQVEQAIRQTFDDRGERAFPFESTVRLGRNAVVKVRALPSGNVFVLFSDITAAVATEQAAKASRTMLRHIADAMPVLIAYLDANQHFVFANKTCEEWWGLPVDQIIGRHARDVMGDEFYNRRRPDIEKALAGEPVKVESLFPGPPRRRTLVQHIPHIGPHGKVLGLYTLVQDVTELTEAKEALERSEVRLALATNAARLGVWEWLPSAQQMIFSMRAREIWGFRDEDAVTLETLQARIHPDQRARVTAQVARALNPEIRDPAPLEYRILHPERGWRWLRVHGQAVFPAGAKSALSYVGTIEDITDRKEAEARLMLLAREVDHRANNLLTIVQGAISLTNADSVERYKQTLTGRIGALARAHQLLATGRWVGASLRRLIEEELRPYDLGGASRVEIGGPDIELEPSVAQAISLAVHELTTNALKYGALSWPNGHIRISWALAGERLSISWQETGGEITVPPRRRGFGAKLIERVIGDAPGGRVAMEFRKEGLSCELGLEL
jgi:PAS domain S-box-containing protein